VVRALGCPANEIPAFDIERDVTFRLAACVQIDPQWQRSFLELTDEAQRLERLEAVFQAALDRDAIGDEIPP
jgi:hypothetical protein